MFSANENILLRQHKRRIVNRIEQSIPEQALDLGTNVMVMQVSCKDPGCVPIETAIIIIFPKSSNELIPGLIESKNGGSFRTKILKPMADVTDDDVLDALPPAFDGGRRTMEKLCVNARDVMIGQITQLFGQGNDDDEETIQDREAMALYLQSCLQQYIAAGCKPPPQWESFAKSTTVPSHADKDEGDGTAILSAVAAATATPTVSIPAKGNVVLRRVLDENESSTSTATKTTTTTTSIHAPTLMIPTKFTTTTTSIRGQPPARDQRAIVQALNTQQSNTISRLFNREHAPGIRQAGCPCCDPENPSTIADSMMML